MALAAALATGVLCALRPAHPSPPAAVRSVEALEAYLDRLTAAGWPPGLTLAVVKDGRFAYCRGFGMADGPRGIPAQAETSYRWWSLTKIPTAIAVLQLAERGRLALEDPVAKHLPFFELESPPPGTGTVTLRHLLNHSSGLPDAGLGLVRWLHRDGDPPVDQTAFAARVFPDYASLAFEPGSQTSYTNVGYMLLGAVIEKASGQAYEDYVQQNVLAPLGMDHTGFRFAAPAALEAAGSHPLVDPLTPLLPILVKHWSALHRETTWRHLWFNRIYTDYTPPTGLIGCAPDLARLAVAYLNGGEWQGRRLLAAATVERMSTVDRVGSRKRAWRDKQQGLGWVVACGERECLEHFGGGPGFGAALRLYPAEGLGLALLSNDTTLDREAILDTAAGVEWSRLVPRL